MSSSLLECVVRDAQQKQNARTSRILITGIVTNVSSAHAVQRSINEFISRYYINDLDHPDHDHQLDVNTITGIMFMINNIAIELIVECDTTTLIALVTHCHTHLVRTNIASFKIVTFVECVPRSFSLYAARSIRHNQSEEWNIPNSPFNVTSLPLPPHIPSPLLTITFSTLHSLLALAGYVKSLHPNERMEFLLSSSSRHLMDRICPVERIQGFAASDELMTLHEFIEAFDAPLQIHNSRDKVWPIEQQTSII